MPLPDPHANEPVVEGDRDLIIRYKEADDAVKAWDRERRRLYTLLTKQLGDAYALTLDGMKVFTYRPQDRYATASLIKAYPDLTEHFFETVVRTEFNVDKFAQHHPDIANQYRVRALNRVEVDSE